MAGAQYTDMDWVLQGFRVAAWAPLVQGIGRGLGPARTGRAPLLHDLEAEGPEPARQDSEGEHRKAVQA